MIVSTPALLCGALVGGGLVVLVRQFMPSHPDLNAVLDRLEATDAPAPAGGGEVREPTTARSRSDALALRIGAAVLARGAMPLSVARQDLDLLSVSVAKHVGDKIVGAVGGLMLPQLAVAFMALSGTHLPFSVPLFVSLGLAFSMWVSTDTNVRSKARKARREFRYAVASYMERARLERGAKAGAEAALHQAAAVGDHWVLVRIRATLDHAKLAGIPPWDALKALADQLDVPELAAQAETFSMAGGEGSSIQTALGKQATVLRGRLLTDELAQANSASERAVIPGTIMFAVVLVIITFPAVSLMLNT
ncbi:hypothetical protein K388_06972 [Streptomyces sp. KhCrAH-43]|uniref:hypothetical protein n=1 Tax=unclassified Streptomyces TaxID=2593676 RepID=UPI000DC208CD|nr:MULTISPECIES: hypothetical protein [unclassified Streptomyces]RAJ48624.1 hypothetical protein K388_06972 [Streptomyces sp. KhCrAH-43]